MVEPPSYIGTSDNISYRDYIDHYNKFVPDFNKIQESSEKKITAMCITKRSSIF